MDHIVEKKTGMDLSMFDGNAVQSLDGRAGRNDLKGLVRQFESYSVARSQEPVA